MEKTGGVLQAKQQFRFSVLFLDKEFKLINDELLTMQVLNLDFNVLNDRKTTNLHIEFRNPVSYELKDFFEALDKTKFISIRLLDKDNVEKVIEEFNFYNESYRGPEVKLDYGNCEVVTFKFNFITKMTEHSIPKKIR